MSATAHQPVIGTEHFHLPSVHVLHEGTGFDYDEDIFIRGRGLGVSVERVVRLVMIFAGRPEPLICQTTDELSTQEIALLEDVLPILMDEDNPDAAGVMKESALREYARQLRIAAGEESACRVCRCSDTRQCSRGCIWVSEHLCSRCV